MDAGARDLAELESSATRINAFETVNVPGLLQSPEFALALFQAGNPESPARAAERFQKFRIQRQEILAKETPPELL